MRSSALRIAFLFALAAGLSPAPAAGQACTDTNGEFRFLNDEFPVGSQNTEFVARLLIANADGPVTFDLDPGSNDLHNGLVLDPLSGLVVGLPTEGNTRSIDFIADDGTPGDGVNEPFRPILQSIDVSINSSGGGGNGASEISSNVFPDGRVGTAYGPGGAGYTLTVTNGVGPTFTFGGSDLPPGLSLNGATGVVSGTPTSPGTYFASFTVYDPGESNIGNTILPITILPLTSDFAFETRLLNNGEVGTPYCDSYLVKNAAGPVTFGASGLPAGLTLGPATGAVTGTPTVAGTFPVTITANDGDNTISTNLSIVIVPSATSTFHWNFFGLPAALVNTLYDRQPPIVLTAEGAAATISYSALGLPGGITYNPGSGELSGTPTQQGEFPVTFTATDGSETITLDLTFIVLPATGGDVSQIVVNFWVTRASLKLGEDGKESWRVSALYNADRRTGNRFDPSTDLFRALLGSHVLQVDPGECTGSVPDQSCSYKSASGEIPVAGAKLTPDKQALAWSTRSDTIAETVPGVLSQTVTLGDNAWRVLLSFDEKGGFRPALAYERTVFVLSKGSISLKGPGLDSAKLSLLLADPNLAYEAGVSTLRVRILDGATELLDRDFTALGGIPKQGVDTRTGKPWVSFKTLPDTALSNRVAMAYASNKGAMKLTLSNLDLSAIPNGEAHLAFELTIGDRAYTTSVTLFEKSEGKYGLAIP